MTPLEILRTRYPESAGWTDCYYGSFPRRSAAVRKGSWRVSLRAEIAGHYNCIVGLILGDDGTWLRYGGHSDPDPGIAMTYATERARAALRELLAGAP
jgi:hypothetical protein